jgi:hypothetical protein
MISAHRMLLIVALVCRPSIGAAQSETPSADSVPDVASLRAPATPAFVLLGISPSDVARPQTPGDLALSFANSGSSVSRLPEDLAIEVSPYWLARHSRLTWRSDSVRSLASSVARTFALSFGTTEKGTEANRSTNLGVGARAMLLSGRLSDTTMKLLRAVDSSAAVGGHIFNRYRLAETRRIDALVAAELQPCVVISVPADREACAARVVQKYQPMRDSVVAAVRANPDFQAELAKVDKAIDNFSLAREGLFWEVAGGAVWDFASGVWAHGRRARTGAWTTLSYEGGKLGDRTTWAPVLVARYLKEDTTASLDIFDVGGRLVASGQTYALSVELVHRFWSGDDAPNSQHRLSGMLEYKLREDAWLFAAMGRDYEAETKDSFIARFGLSFSLKKARYKGVD